MKVNDKVCIIFFLCLIILRLSGQDSDPQYIQYSVFDGLPSAEVYDLEIDSLNQIWISTDRGVCVYNGYEFKTYTTEDGLADNCNFEIFKDSQNRLWFNGYNQTLSIYKEGRFRPYEFNSILTKDNSGKWITDLYENKENQLYFSRVGYSNILISKFNESTPPERVDFGFSVDSLSSMVSSNSNFIVYDGIPFILFHDLSFYSIFSTSNSSKNFYRRQNMLYAEDCRTGKFSSYTLDHSIEKLFIDRDENLWACTLKGIYCFLNADVSKPPIHYFKDLAASSIIQDLEGNYWMSTNESGIYYIPSFEFFNVHNNFESDESFSYHSIGVLKDHILFGTSNAGFLSFNKSGSKQYYSLQDEVRLDQISRQIKFNEKNGVIYIGSNILLTEKDRQLNIKVVKADKDTTEYIMPRARKFLLSDGTKLIDVFKGFNVFDSLGVLIYRSRNHNSSFSRRITCLVEEDSNSILLGTLNGLFEIKNREYEKVEEVLVNEKSYERISDLKVDIHGNVWVGTIGGGLYYKQDSSVTELKMVQGLSSNMINQILLGPNSTVWLATNNGINVFSYEFYNGELKTSSIVTLDNFDGLISNYVNDIEFWNDKIWIATNDGISSFDPSIIDRTYPEVPIVINQFIVNDSSYTNKVDTELEYFQNDIFIQYTGVRYRKNKNAAIYKYRLTKDHFGEEEGWYETSETNIRYNDLSPGSYRFEITAKNKIGEWNGVSEVLQFTITPHFTDTRWFRFLVAVGLILLGCVLFYYLRHRYLEREMREKELKEFKLKSQEFELATLRNQMNPHFVFNSLNSIQNFIYKKDVTKANHFLAKFSKLMRNSLEYTRLDSITLNREVAFLTNYLELEQMRFPDKFDFVIDVHKDLEVDGLLVPPLLLQPILENSIKHAFNDISYKGRIELTIRESMSDMLLIQLSDNGKGIQHDGKLLNDTESRQSLGMKIVTDRITLINQSDENNNTRIEIENMYLRDRGLRVKIYLPLKYNYE